MPPLALSPRGVESDEHNFFNGLLTPEPDHLSSQGFIVGASTQKSTENTGHGPGQMLCDAPAPFPSAWVDGLRAPLSSDAAPAGGGYNRFMLDANRKTLYDFASMQTLNDRYLASANRRRPWPNFTTLRA